MFLDVHEPYLANNTCSLAGWINNSFPPFCAGYYSYLYAKCFAATIWKKLCQEDPLSPSAGFALRSNFLQHGGAKEPTVLLYDLVGDGIYRHYDGGIIPDISSLCDEMKLWWISAAGPFVKLLHMKQFFA